MGEEGKVLAIEPTKFAFDKLNANLKLNKNLSHCIDTYQVMLVENDNLNSKKELYSSWPIVKNQQIDSHITHGGVLKSLEGCSTETLDGFCDRIDLSRLDLIKLDVDGAEAAVINGGMKTLKRFHPTIIMEFAPYVYENTTTFLSMVRTLKNLNYQFYYLNGRRDSKTKYRGNSLFGSERSFAQHYCYVVMFFSITIFTKLPVLGASFIKISSNHITAFTKNEGTRVQFFSPPDSQYRVGKHGLNTLTLN